MRVLASSPVWYLVNWERKYCCTSPARVASLLVSSISSRRSTWLGGVRGRYRGDAGDLVRVRVSVVITTRVRVRVRARVRARARARLR